MCRATELREPSLRREDFLRRNAITLTTLFADIRRSITVLAVATLCMAGPAAAAELVLFQAEGCPFCEAWDREIGSIYHLTDEARRLPLRRVDITARRPADLAGIKDIRYTPTFVATVEGREIGRIVGYHSQDQFWGLLGEIIEALPQAAN